MLKTNSHQPASPNASQGGLTARQCGGYVTAALLISAATASIVLYALALLVINQYQLIRRQTADQQAYFVAEAGVNYYRWHLAHNPTDFTDGTGQPGPYLHAYTDPQGGTHGYYSLDITPPQPGSSVLVISSTGWSSALPDLTRTITVKYGKTSAASYAFLYNNHIWLTSGLNIINGPVHANGGIRSDAINNSIMSSALETYTCTNKYGGCSPPETKPGIWGDGHDQSLWVFPVPQVDFNSFAADYDDLEAESQSVGVYLAPSTKWGYHLVFNSNGTFDVYEVNTASSIKGGKGTPGCDQLYSRIDNETLLNSYQTSNYPLIFVEDDLWIEGTVTSSLTVVAAKFPIDSEVTDIWLNGNLVYPAKNGTVQLGLISQKNIYMHRDVPDDFEIDAALMAQSGSILRHNYAATCADGNGNAVRNSLSVYGSIIAAGESQWNWGETIDSGFINRTITFDANLRNNPPPYFPDLGIYDVLSWTE